jgi:hypothetical protein
MPATKTQSKRNWDIVRFMGTGNSGVEKDGAGFGHAADDLVGRWRVAFLEAEFVEFEMAEAGEAGLLFR